MDAITGLVGRAREREQALAAIARGANVAGASQRRHRQERLPAPSAPRVRGRGADRHLGPATSTKHVLEALCQQLHAAVGLGVPAGLLGARARAKALRTGELPWSDLAQPIRRLAVPETTRIIVAALGKRPCLVLIEALEVPPQQAERYIEVIEHTPVVAALETGNRRVRIARLLWRFPTVLELKPLPLEACETIATAWLAHNPIRFSDPRTRTRFIHHLAQHSGGIPAAIQGMLEAAAAPGEITPASAASLAHGAGVRHLDMTPLVVIGLVLAMAGRYISRGVGEVEMRVLSGVATALFMGLRVVLWQMRGR